VLVFFNGSDDASYEAIDLDGFVTDANGYFVLGNAAVVNVGAVFADNTLQNGADAVALYVGDDTDFPIDTPVTAINLVDALVYDTNDADDAGLLAPLLLTGQPQINEDGNGSKDFESNQRCPDSAGGPRVTTAYRQSSPTPGSQNCLVPEADLSITKTDGVAFAVPGASVTYTITASNAGPTDALGATVTDNFPAACTSVNWSCVGAGGGSCGASGMGNINDAVDLPLGGSVTYTAICAIASSAGGNLANTATVSGPDPDPNMANNSATDTDTYFPMANVAISKDDGVTSLVPGTSTTYTIIASNAGPSDSSGSLIDIFPAACTSVSWTCASAGGSVCLASGMGDINHLITLRAGGSVTYTATCITSPAATGNLSNTATLNIVGASLVNATDTNSFTPQADLVVTKDNGVSNATPGGSVTWTIGVSNAGPSDAPGSSV
ncbi:MAG: DUF11 domain-containing protein, partial [Xanthomonadales bacterium]|nr:DUF11 domain-containing protein [Xanthomonadales bacterium]